MLNQKLTPEGIPIRFSANRKCSSAPSHVGHEALIGMYSHPEEATAIAEWVSHRNRGQPIRAKRRRRALAITLTEDRAIAAAAMIGDSSRPKTGYRTPAAIGTPAAL